MRTALRHPSFARLAGAYLLSEVGDWLVSIALAIVVFDHTGSAVATTGAFLSARVLPSFAVPGLTARLDRLPVQRALGLLFALQATACAGLAAFSATFSLPMLLVLACINGAAAVTARAIVRAGTVHLLEPEGLLREGNAALNLGFTVILALGPAAGGLAAATIGVPATLSVAAGCYLVNVMLAATARGAGTAGAADGAVETEPWRERTRAGLRYVRDHRLLRSLLAAEALLLLFFTVVGPIEIIYAKRSLGSTDAGYGALLAAWGIGGILGGTIFARQRERAGFALIAASTIAIGVSYGTMAIADSLVVACVASALGGVGNGVQWIAVITAAQEATDKAFIARVAALFESMSAAVPGLGYILGGAVTAIVSPRAAFAVAGIGVLVVVTGWLVVSPWGAARVRNAKSETTPA
jgi:MFS family permease